MPNHEIDIREAVRLSGYSRIHVYNLIFEGKVRARKDTSRSSPIYFIERDSLLSYLESRGRAANESNS